MKQLLTFLLAGALVAVALLALVWIGQRRMMYFPMGIVPPPDAAGLREAATITFDTADGLTLHGWYVAPEPAHGTVIVFNGNAGNRAYRSSLARALSAHGLAVLLFDYRGFGGNPGSPSETGLMADARAARAWLAAHPGAASLPVTYFGESLGAAVAAALAVESPPAVLVLRSPFTSMAEVGAVHYPVLPVRWLVRDRYATIDLIARVRSPLLVIAGDRDSIVPVEQSRRVYDAATADKTLVILPGADHNDDELLSGPALIEAVVSFVKRHAAG